MTGQTRAVDGRLYDIDPRLRAKYGAKSMPHECVPDEVYTLSTVERAVAAQLDADRELLKLRYALDQVPDDVPSTQEERAVLEGEERRKKLDRRITRSLKAACQRCPSRAVCPARLA